MRLCFVCKSQIESGRLEAIPETRLCKQHGQEIEKYGGEFRITISQERTSKQGSLKLNYGGISTATIRNQRGMEQLRDDYEQSRWATE